MTKLFLDELFDAGVLIETGVDGLYGRSGDFEEVIAGLDRIITSHGGKDGATRVHFPPGMARSFFEKSGYMKSFPQLAGTVHSFMGNDVDHCKVIEALESQTDWTFDQKATDIVLTPAACYPLYPTVAKKGPLPKQGRLYDLTSYCFRHEPSKEPTRMQLFRMREYVRFGTADQVMEFRQTWMDRGTEIIKGLGLPLEIDVANDPFFGKAGRMMKVSQRDQALKFELLVPVNSTENPTACLSFNYHQDHFGEKWGIEGASGERAHTACVGFGLERITLALFRHHGTDVAQWPAAVRAKLWG